MSRPVAVAACLATLAIVASADPAGAADGYATASAAVRKAIRDGVRSQVPGARILELRAGCYDTLAVGERADCDGGFRLRRGRRRAVYILTPRSRAERISPAAIRARAEARPSPRSAGFPPRIDVVAVLRGRVPPAERTVHGTIGLANATRPSRALRLAFPVPFGWRQAYGEAESGGPDRIEGAVERLYGKRPGGVCTVELHVFGRLTATPPVERNGRLFTSRDDREGMPISSRATDASGTTTWFGTVFGGTPQGVRAGPAPPGLGPRHLATLVVIGTVTHEVVRYGRPGPDGLPLLEPTPAQLAACKGAAAEAARLHLARAIAGARAVRR